MFSWGPLFCLPTFLGGIDETTLNQSINDHTETSIEMCHFYYYYYYRPEPGPGPGPRYGEIGSEIYFHPFSSSSHPSMMGALFVILMTAAGTNPKWGPPIDLACLQ